MGAPLLIEFEYSHDGNGTFILTEPRPYRRWVLHLTEDGHREGTGYIEEYVEKMEVM